MGTVIEAEDAITASMFAPVESASPFTPVQGTPPAQVEGGPLAPAPTTNLDLSQVVELSYKGEPLKVTVQEALDGYLRQEDYTRKRQADAEALKAGETYFAALEAFESQPQKAVGIVRAWIDSAIEAHGDAVYEGLRQIVQELLPEGLDSLDLDNMTDETKAIYQKTQLVERQQRREIAELKKTINEMTELMKPVVQKARENEVLPLEVEMIKRQFPAAATLTPGDLAKMKADTGETDPLKAFKLATYGVATATAHQQGVRQGMQAVVTPPATGAGNFPDPMDPNTTIEDMMEAFYKAQRPN
jgi:hypothetical protein